MPRSPTNDALQAEAMANLVDLSGDGPDGGALTLWGRDAYGRFDGRDGDLSVHGEVAGGTLGVDWAAGPWLAGLALSHSSGWGGYE